MSTANDTDAARKGSEMIHLRSKEFFALQFPLHVFEEKHKTYAPHSHEFFEIGYIAEGQGTHCLCGESTTLQTGDIYLIRPDEVHMYYPAEGTTLRLINVLFLPDILTGTTLDMSRTPAMTGLPFIDLIFDQTQQQQRRLNLQGMHAHEIDHLFQFMLNEAALKPAGHELALQSLFIALLVWLSRAYAAQLPPALPNPPGVRRRDTIVAAARAHIEQHAAEALTLEAIAAAAAVSPSYLAHVFKAQTQRSVIRYLHDYRVRRICDELANSDAPVQKIAAQMGFNDPSFFHRVFHRTVGCSPLQYRRRSRPEARLQLPTE